MSEENKTTTTTDDKKQLLWANVPWGVVNKDTKGIQITGNVEPGYLSVALANQLAEKEQKLATVEAELQTLRKKLKEQTLDTTTTDVP
jgi:hypothetical protein